MESSCYQHWAYSHSLHTSRMLPPQEVQIYPPSSMNIHLQQTQVTLQLLFGGKEPLRAAQGHVVS